MTDASSPKPLRVLLAEDVDGVRLAARTLLEDRGHHVTEARTGPEAWDALQEEPFDIVLMDVVMPGMDGIEVTRRLRATEDPDEATPVLAFTAGGPSARPERCLDAGMNAFLRKPVNGPILIETVERFGVGKGEPGPPGDRIPQSLLHVADGDPDHLAEMARVFLEFAPLQLRELRVAQAEEDAPRLTEMARRLRGSARVFRADSILIPAERLEFLSSSGVLDQTDPLVEHVAGEVEELERSLKRVLDSR